MTDAAKLAAAVLLYFHGGRWTELDRVTWRDLTGSDECTSKKLCDLARAVAAREAARDWQSAEI